MKYWYLFLFICYLTNIWPHDILPSVSQLYRKGYIIMFNPIFSSVYAQTLAVEIFDMLVFSFLDITNQDDYAVFQNAHIMSVDMFNTWMDATADTDLASDEYDRMFEVAKTAAS